MDFFDWEFSKEAQPELNKFLEVVNRNTSENCILENKMVQIFPELKTIPDVKLNISIISDDVIMIDDDEPETAPHLPESILNLTQTVIKSENEELNEEVYAFTEYLLEYLENDNLVPENQQIIKLIDFNNVSLNFLFTKLSEISDNAIYNLNKSICQLNAKNIPELFCKLVLLPKFKNAEPTNKILLTMKLFCQTFPEQIRQILLTPDSGNIQNPQTIINILTNSEKLNLLKDLIDVTTEIDSAQIPILECLISSDLDDIIVRRLINLMAVSFDKFKTEKSFVKLLITVINNLGPQFEDQEQIIFNIIEKSKTANKILAQKAYKKWISKFNVQ